MSWFSGITDRAGALLEKMDQAAATSLQEVGIGSPSSRNVAGGSELGHGSIKDTPTIYEPTTTQAWTTPSERGAAVAQVLVGTASGSSSLLTSTPKSEQKSVSSNTKSPLTPISSTKKQSLSEDSLFEFLNAPSPKPSGERKTLFPASASSRASSVASGNSSTATVPHLRSSPAEEKAGTSRSSSQEESSQEDKECDEEKAVEDTTDEDKDMPDSSLNVTSDVTITAASALDSQPEREEEESPRVDDTQEEEKKKEMEALKQQVSSLDLENRLLKREVSSLNEELGTVMNRMNETSSNTSHYESEIHALREQASRLDHMIRQLRSREEDLQAAVDARDAQIQVLRTQLSATDSAVEAAKRDLLLSKKEQERLLQDASLSSGAHHQALESLKSQLSQVQAQLTKEREQHEVKRAEFMERESLLQSQLMQVSDNLTAVQRQVVAEQSRHRESHEALESTKKALQQLRKEHEEYKQRAAGILQAKEKLIEGLQQGSVGGTAGGESSRLEDMKLEKEHIQAQLTSALQQLQNTRRDMQALEEKSSQDMEGVLEELKVCEGVLTEERQRHASTRNDLSRLTQELEMVREDLVQERTTHREAIMAKDSEMATLNLQLTSVTPGKAELEARLHELTESLIEKQTTLETLSSEKTTLNVQLQRLQVELMEARKAKQNTAPHTAVHVNGPEHTSPLPRESSQVRSMSSVIPSLEQAPSGSKLHRVRRAVNTMDRVSIRLGAFLKRYPQARLFVLIYVLVLHLWVMIVLLTYSPEIHGEP